MMYFYFRHNNKPWLLPVVARVYYMGGIPLDVVVPAVVVPVFLDAEVFEAVLPFGLPQSCREVQLQSQCRQVTPVGSFPSDWESGERTLRCNVTDSSFCSSQFKNSGKSCMYSH